ncbi:hypothetical protein [Kribbella sp. NPDC051137]|uniref:hypothetical protein n=1 Tax=Kribbella sp. NPDC051137 TaxID=3155045 RepID=UPI00343E24D4
MTAELARATPVFPVQGPRTSTSLCLHSHCGGPVDSARAHAGEAFGDRLQAAENPRIRPSAGELAPQLTRGLEMPHSAPDLDVRSWPVGEVHVLCLTCLTGWRGPVALAAAAEHSRAELHPRLLATGGPPRAVRDCCRAWWWLAPSEGGTRSLAVYHGQGCRRPGERRPVTPPVDPARPTIRDRLDPVSSDVVALWLADCRARNTRLETDR